MKTYLFELPNKNYDNKGILKNTVINHIAEKYPFLTMEGIDTPKSEYAMQYAGPGDFIVLWEDGMPNISGLPKTQATLMNEFGFKHEKYNLLDQFDIAMKKIDDYAKAKGYSLDKGYDYKWFGLPVRIYQNFVQIGMTIIPKKKDRYILPTSLTKQEITQINNVIYNINIIVNEAA